MSRQAYNSVMEELKGRIKGLGSKRLRRTAQDPVNGGEHEEPDGDEDADGNEPNEPEEGSVGKGQGDAPDGPEPAQVDEDSDDRTPTPCPHCGR
jgi:hypothetical protein